MYGTGIIELRKITENQRKAKYQDNYNVYIKIEEMSRIKGGKKAASDLVADFRIHYKNRKAMMEILSGF